jgi:hypothetical protein
MRIDPHINFYLIGHGAAGELQESCRRAAGELQESINDSYYWEMKEGIKLCRAHLRLLSLS